MPNPSFKDQLRAELEAAPPSKVMPLPPFWVLQLQFGLMSPLGGDVWGLSNTEDWAFLFGKVVGLRQAILISFRKNLPTPTVAEHSEEIAKPFHEAGQASDVSSDSLPIYTQLALAMSSQPLRGEAIKTGLQEVKADLAEACDWPSKMAVPFFKGFATTFAEGIPNGNNFPEKTLPRGNLYRILLDNWQHIETLRSMKEIHKWACEQLGEDCVGDPPTFTRFCNRFGLKRGRTGRPNKKSDMKSA